MRGQHSNGTPAGLTSVACFSATDCIAVGHGINRRGYIVPWADDWDGSTWGHMTIPSPSSSTDGELLGMSCPTTAFCFAVGFGTYPTSAAPEKPVSAKWDGTTWSVNVAFHPPGAARTVFNGVSCDSATHCMAVGQYSANSSTLDTALSETWSSGTWTKHPAAIPTGASATSFNAVLCSAANACTAVGSYVDSTSDVLPLVETWNGSKWKLQSAPGSGQLLALSCSGTAPCMAVGCATGNAGCAGGPPLVELFDGTSWTVGPAPDGEYLQGVSCTSATTCTAVGQAGGFTYATAWDGTGWTDQATPNPSGSMSADLAGVTCLSVTQCEAVGSYVDSMGNPYTLAEGYAG